MTFDEVAVCQPTHKPWGLTRCVHRDDTHEVWHASIEPGGYSSRHSHGRKPNLFYVVAGELKVEVFRSALATVPCTTHAVGPGQKVVIEDGVWHRFVAAGPVELLEVYWARLRGEDIDRADEGGKLPA